jgi:GNAT superfamily N-acetyltransferase
MAYPVWFDNEHLTAQEVFWWVEPQHRGGFLGTELRQGLEDWACNKGCLTMEMGALEALRPEVLTALYARKGFDAKERTFIKRLV